MHSTTGDPTLLLALVAVAEELSFSRAAMRLGITKGTVSRKIARLEESAGTALLFRTTRTVSLTAGGRELYERARGPVHALADVTLDLPPDDAPLAGVITLASPQDVGSVMLPRVIEAFVAAHPRVTFDVRIGSERINLVRAGVDLALRVSVKQMPRSSLVTRKLCPLPGGLFASPHYVARRGHPRGFGDPAHAWLTFEPNTDPTTTMRRERRALDMAGTLTAHRSDDFGVLRELARRGLGVALLPLFFAEAQVRTGELIPVAPRATFPVSATLHMVSPSQRRISARVTAFKRHLVDTLARAHPASPRQ